MIEVAMVAIKLLCVRFRDIADHLAVHADLQTSRHGVDLLATRGPRAGSAPATGDFDRQLSLDMHLQARAGNRESGMTLIEIVIVLMIVSVLLTIGLPSFADFVRSTRLASSMSDLNSDLQLARSESIRRNSRVLVCPRSIPATTPETCAAVLTATTWVNGWLVCYDANTDGACDASTASDPNPVRIRNAPASPMSLTGPAATLIFFPVGNASVAANFTMTGGTSASRSVTVASSGSITSSKSGS